MSDFHSFVVFAEMRTGSNFLEANLNALDGVRCHGEAFNPHFIGYPNRTEILGLTLDMRDADPARLLHHIRTESGVLGGFRYFSGHDPRVFDMVVSDPRCAKIVLTRNPIESYVSRKIAAATGQWKLTNVKHARSEQVLFEAAEFEDHLARHQARQVDLLNALQRSGQTAFYVDYEDLQDLDVMNGLAAWLGVPARLEGLDRSLKKQNPEPLESKVVNYEAMEAALARADRFNLSRTPNFEPRRGPVIPTYAAAATSPLLYLPIRSTPEALVHRWLAALDGAPPQTGFNHRGLRAWKAAHPGFRSFTVLRHPVARLHAAYCDRIVALGRGSFPEIRETLRRTFDLPLPKGEIDESYDRAAHRDGFLKFLAFVKANLGRQTSLRADPAWSTQFAVLQGIASHVSPDAVVREDEMATELPRLAALAGVADAPPPEAETDPHRDALIRIYDAEVEAAARDAMARDYEAFGFRDWSAQAA